MIVRAMEALFKHDNYRKFLRELIYSTESKRGTQVQMAKAIGCQAAYLSQVLKGSAEFTEDHAIKLARYLKLSGTACEYFLLLVRMARAGTPELREYLDRRRLVVLRENEDASRRVQSENPILSDELLQKYFSTWIPSTVHIATSGEDFQSVEAIARRLKLKKAKVEETLLFLRSLGLVKEEKLKWSFTGKSIHFPKNSPINSTHQIARRQQVIRSIEQENPEDLHFSSVFTLSRESFKKLKLALLGYIEESHGVIHASGTEEIYGMCLDLFEVK